MPCISRPAVLYLRPAPALAYCCLFLINRHADAWLCVFTVVCLRCLHTVTVPCLTPTGRPACTLAVNLTSVSHSCKCCNFSCHFLSHIMTLSHCFTWCSSYPLYARRHSSFKGGPSTRVAAMLYISRKCPDVLLTVIKWSCLIAVAPAWLRPSPKNEFVLSLLPLAQGRCLRPESSVCFGTARPRHWNFLSLQ